MIGETIFQVKNMTAEKNTIQDSTAHPVKSSNLFMVSSQAIRFMQLRYGRFLLKT